MTKKKEQDKDAATGAMFIREVPVKLRLAFRAKALQEGKTMQEKIIELMQRYTTGEGKGGK